MATKVTIPKMDANMEEANIGEWHVNEGETVRAGDPLVDLITSKTTYEYESPESGTLLKILAPENSVLPIGYAIAFIGEPDERVPEVKGENQTLLERFKSEKAERDENSEQEGERSESTPKREPRTRVRSTPSAKRLARENNVDIRDVKRRFNADVVNEKMVADHIRET